MKLYSRLYLLLLVVFLISAQGFSQRDTINTDKLIIIKQYSPSVNDAFKIKQKPSEKDTIKQTRQDVTYEFIDVPVASTFTPAKGTASGVRIAPKETYFQNYARFGAGNYSNIIADFYSGFDINRYRNIDVGFNHISSRGSIDGVVLDDDFSDTNLKLDLTSQDRFFNWNSGIDLNHREVNYYGLSPTQIDNLTTDQIGSIESLQSYTKIGGFAGIEFLDGVFKEADANVYYFTDNYKSSEQFIDVNARLDVPIQYEFLTFNGGITFLNGSFEQLMFSSESTDYQQFKAHLNPFVKLKFDRINLKIGAKAVYFSNLKSKTNDLFFYPDVQAEFMLNQERLKLDFGVVGDLQQNTYQQFTQDNPFLSPNQHIRPSDNQYKAYAGFTAKVMESLSLSSQVFYSKTNDHAFFKANPSLDYANGQNRRGFDYQNSFSVEYNNLETIGISADLAYQIDSDFIVGFFGKYSDYSVDNNEEAWNLPEIEFKAYSTWDFTKNWSFSAALFYVGDRLDVQENTFINSFDLPISTGEIKSTVDGYLDVNASVEYQINPRLSAFISGNNLLNSSYNRWQNFEVQRLQALGGLVYQFNW